TRYETCHRRAPLVLTRQVFLLIFVHSRARPFASLATKSCTLRSYSRIKYEPGVHTGITRSDSFGTLRLAGICMRISTRSKCVHGSGIETVNETSEAFGFWAGAETAATTTTVIRISFENKWRLISFFDSGFGVGANLTTMAHCVRTAPV